MKTIPITKMQQIKTTKVAVHQFTVLSGLTRSRLPRMTNPGTEAG